MCMGALLILFVASGHCTAASNSGLTANGKHNRIHSLSLSLSFSLWLYYAINFNFHPWKSILINHQNNMSACVFVRILYHVVDINADTMMLILLGFVLVIEFCCSCFDATICSIELHLFQGVVFCFNGRVDYWRWMKNTCRLMILL